MAKAMVVSFREVASWMASQGTLQQREAMGVEVDLWWSRYFKSLSKAKKTKHVVTIYTAQENRACDEISGL